MPSRHYIACLWPGLPQLWYCGVWQGLIPAILFGVFLNVLLVARLIYPEWLSPFGVRVACWLFVGLWIYGALQACRALPKMLAPREVSQVADAFSDAQRSFLAGQWFDCEQQLKTCLTIDPRDAPALLQLAAVYRTTDRLTQAHETLSHLQTLETAAVWWLEIEAEKKRLRLTEKESAPESSEAGENTTSEADRPEQEIPEEEQVGLTAVGKETSEAT